VNIPQSYSISIDVITVGPRDYVHHSYQRPIIVPAGSFSSFKSFVDQQGDEKLPAAVLFLEQGESTPREAIDYVDDVIQSWQEVIVHAAFPERVRVGELLSDLSSAFLQDLLNSEGRPESVERPHAFSAAVEELKTLLHTRPEYLPIVVEEAREELRFRSMLLGTE